MIEFNEVFDPNSEEGTIITRRRNADTAAMDDNSPLSVCQGRLDDLYDRKYTVSQFLGEMNNQYDTFTAIAFTNAFLQLATSCPSFYKDLIAAIKILSISELKDIESSITYTIINGAAMLQPKVDGGDDANTPEKVDIKYKLQVVDGEETEEAEEASDDSETTDGEDVNYDAAPTTEERTEEYFPEDTAD